MHNTNKTGMPTTIASLVPGYAFYSDIGTGLATSLLNTIEWILGLHT